MTKKRIRYSELSAPILDERRSADTPAAPSALVPSRPRAPLDLARALAAARAAESPPGSAVATPVLETPPIVREVAGRLTPIRGTLVIGRPTPGLGSPTIPTRRPPARVDSVLPAGSPSLRDRARSRAGRVELLVFAVGGEWFGVELALIEEAIDLPVVRHIPEMPPAMLGVITVRSALTSVYSPATALGLADGLASPSTRSTTSTRSTLATCAMRRAPRRTTASCSACSAIATHSSRCLRPMR
jgi:hypothetical protein